MLGQRADEVVRLDQLNHGGYGSARLWSLCFGPLGGKQLGAQAHVHHALAPVHIQHHAANRRARCRRPARRARRLRWKHEAHGGFIARNVQYSAVRLDLSHRGIQHAARRVGLGPGGRLGRRCSMQRIELSACCQRAAQRGRALAAAG